MAHHVHFVGHPCLRAVMGEQGKFTLEYRLDWLSSNWGEISETPMSIDQVEHKVMGGHYNLFEA